MKDLRFQVDGGKEFSYIRRVVNDVDIGDILDHSFHISRSDLITPSTSFIQKRI
ncbi:hypothetical protein KAW48_11110 [candidate division WOR-3 bacterium]|nr:hypothetical protein [candidate division WOR-3 bacterium]